jgi:hypothetical protein
MLGWITIVLICWRRKIVTKKKIWTTYRYNDILGLYPAKQGWHVTPRVDLSKKSHSLFAKGGLFRIYPETERGSTYACMPGYGWVCMHVWLLCLCVFMCMHIHELHPESNATCFFLSKYFFLNCNVHIMKNDTLTPHLFFHKVPVCLFGFVTTMNKCLDALSVQCLTLLV